MAIIEKIGFDVGQAITALNQLSSTINNTNLAIANMNNVARNTGGLQQASKSVQTFSLSLTTLAKGLAIQQVTRGIGALFGAFSDVSQQTVDFELAVIRINNILETNEKGIERLGKGLRQAALDTGRTLDEISEAAQEAFQNNLGKNVPDTLNLITGAADNLAKVTGSSLTSSVNSLSSVLKSYNLDASAAADVTDILFVAFDKGRISLEELENRLGTVTPQANALGLEFDQAAAAVASLTLSGLNSATAMTQLRNIFDKLIRPTDDLKEAFKKLGVASGKDLVKKFNGELQPALRALLGAFKGNEQAVAKAFNTIRGQLGVLNLLANEGTNLTDVLEAMESRFGRAAAAADQVRQSLSVRLDTEYARLNDLLLQTGFSFANLKLTALNFTREFVQGLIVISQSDTFQKLSGYVQLFVDSSIVFVNQLIDKLTRAVAFAAEKIVKLFDIIAGGFEGLVDLVTATSNKINELFNPTGAAEDQRIKQTADALDNLNTSVDKTKDRITELFKAKEAFGLQNNLGEVFNKLAQIEAGALGAASILRQEFVKTNTVIQTNIEAAERYRSILSTEFSVASAFAGPDTRILIGELSALSAKLSEIQQKSTQGDVLDRQGLLEQIDLIQQKIAAKEKEAGPDSKIVQALRGQVEATREIVLGQQKKPVLEQKAAEAAETANAALAEQERIAAAAGVSMEGLAQSARDSADAIGNIPNPQVDASASIAQMRALEEAAIAAARAIAQTNSGVGAGFYHGGRVAYRAAGGPTRGQDKIPAMLSAGEFVMNSRSSGRFFSQLQAMNSGQNPAFRESGGPVNNFGDINVNVAGGAGSENPDQMARQIASGLRRELRRKSSRIS